MLESYTSREGVLQALSVLAGTPLSDELREQVIENTLGGTLEAKQAWTKRGMNEDVSAGVDAVTVQVTIVVGDRDQVERAPALRETFAHFLPHATFRVLDGIGHLSPLEARTPSPTSALACLKASDQDRSHSTAGGKRTMVGSQLLDGAFHRIRTLSPRVFPMTAPLLSDHRVQGKRSPSERLYESRFLETIHLLSNWERLLVESSTHAWDPPAVQGPDELGRFGNPTK
jgi:hypothetical protein